MQNNWTRSSTCSSGTCVEVRRLPDIQEVAIRNSKPGWSSALVFSEEEWRVFVEGVKRGEFDV